MKKFSLILLLTVLSFGSYAKTAKEACKVLKGVAAELQEQIPLKVDYMTTLSGVQALYVSKSCMLNYMYIIDTDQLLKEMVAENELTREENVAFLKTDEGFSNLEQVLGQIANNAKDRFEVFTEIKGMKITYTYTFDDLSFKPITALVLDTN
ncbi:hypothetical protein [Ferrimonas sp. YFM]|uniref:hypothetical protein n=1 Tax=Ferrimonas sp. YFM TaxID=3028878 RepID=UPI0025738D0E|nr:hypothetical protein [Ferrimonas sp. YFM]BDY05745.1 hypothetical protein F0521_27860 [Ferrimonas sp. YFM]